VQVHSADGYVFYVQDGKVTVLLYVRLCMMKFLCERCTYMHEYRMYFQRVQESVTGAGPCRSNYAGTDIGMPRTNTGESKLVQVQVQVHRNLLTLFKFTLCPSATLQ
jgi:hypothetical protein